MIQTTKHGEWVGINKLWYDKPEPRLSDGKMQVGERSVAYEWAYDGVKHTGKLEFFGPTSSFRATWSDSWHQSEMTELHGYVDSGVLRLYGTYPDGEGGEWGWKIELDLREPKLFQLRMFNVEPNGTIHIAVDLRGKRNV